MDVYKVSYEWEYGETIDSYWYDKDKATATKEALINNLDLRDDDGIPYPWKVSKICIKE